VANVGAERPGLGSLLLSGTNPARRLGRVYSCYIWTLLIVLVVCAMFVVVIWAAIAGRGRSLITSERPPELRDQPPILSSRTLVRQYRMYQWVEWNSRYGGGPQLTIRPKVVEVSAPQGFVREPRTIRLRSDGCSIWLDRVGLWGLPFRRRECIRLVAKAAEGSVDLAPSPHWVGGVVALDTVDLAITPDCGIDVALKALVQSGCHPRADH